VAQAMVVSIDLDCKTIVKVTVWLAKEAMVSIYCIKHVLKHNPACGTEPEPLNIKQMIKKQIGPPRVNPFPMMFDCDEQLQWRSIARILR
jgi:hypothetical protein